MAGIIYTAIDRGQLITSTSPDHAEGTAYSIDVKLQQFTELLEAPKSSHVSIAGNVETVLKRTAKVMSAVFIWPHTENEDVEEWLYSVAGGEIFTFDAYGTTAVPDSAISVVCMNDSFSFGRMTHGSTPWRSTALTLRYNL